MNAARASWSAARASWCATCASRSASCSKYIYLSCYINNIYIDYLPVTFIIG
jgi:hypothetical protein